LKRRDEAKTMFAKFEEMRSEEKRQSEDQLRDVVRRLADVRFQCCACPVFHDHEGGHLAAEDPQLTIQQATSRTLRHSIPAPWMIAMVVPLSEVKKRLSRGRSAVQAAG